MRSLTLALILLVAWCMLGCNHEAVVFEMAAQTIHPTEFKAVGNFDPDHKAERGRRGEIIVTFDQLPTQMNFCLPSFPCLVTENGIHYYNGWTETYDEAAGEGSCEPLMDWPNTYSRMWIESQNDARIVVAWRAALVSSEGIIAHKDAPQVAPYGPGDWVDERFIIYPDGVHVRHSKIYTYFAPTSKPFGWDRDPPNYIFEFQEMLFLGTGNMPEQDIQTEALTLIKMDGSAKTVSYDPYPIHFDPEEEDLYHSFGDFWNANAFVVNTRSRYHPFTIGRDEGVSISPYAPERKTRKYTFQSWPQEPITDEGYHGVALGHIIHRTLYEKTDTTISQIYLSGFTDLTEPQVFISTLGRSWLNAPELWLKEGSNTLYHGYEPAERAYLLTNSQAEDIHVTLEASSGSPVMNPTFIITGWKTGGAKVTLNEMELTSGRDLRVGFYHQNDIHGLGTVQDVLVVWLRRTSTEPLSISIQRIGV